MKTVAQICMGIVGVAAICFGSGCTHTQAPQVQASANVDVNPVDVNPKESKKLLDSYLEYDELRKLYPEKVIETLPEYQQAVADHDARINGKVGSISDPELRVALIKQAGIPEVNKYDFHELANKEIARKRAAFLADHKDCYFILGTYEFYLPKRQMAVFNLKKMGAYEHAEDFVKNSGFGQSIPYRKDKYGYFMDKKGRQSDAGSALYDYARNVDDIDSDSASEGGTFFSDKPKDVSSRYREDWLNRDDLIKYGLLVPIDLGQMDAIYTAVRSKFSKQINDINASEMKFGGDWNPLDHSQWIKHCTGTPSCDFDPHIESFVRRQAIWVLAQGDPMDPNKMRVDKAWVVVGGPDIFLTLK